MIKKEYIFVSTGYAGGASRFINDHITYLAKKNKKTVLVDDEPSKTFSKIPNRTLIKKVKVNKFNLNSREKLKKLFFDNKAEKIVFLTNYAFLIKYFSLIKEFKKNKIKIILTVHSGLFNLTLKKYIAGLIFSLIYKKVDFLYFGSKSAKKWWLKFYPWMKIEKNLVRYNGVEFQKNLKFRTIKKKMCVSFVGRLERENNPEFFLKIANDYSKKNSSVIFNIFGNGVMLNHLKNITKNQNIRFYGWREKKEIYKNSDIIIITSNINNFPYVALEAKSFGIPIISCSKGDIRRIIKNNFDGYISYTNSTETFIRLIDKILNKYCFFSKNSIRRSRSFEIGNALNKFWKNIL